VVLIPVQLRLAEVAPTIRFELVLVLLGNIVRVAFPVKLRLLGTPVKKKLEFVDARGMGGDEVQAFVVPLVRD
jgi:hypothetical protein